MAVTLFRSAQGTISRPSPRHLSFSCIRGCLFRSNKGSPRDMDANSALVIESAQNSRGASIADDKKHNKRLAVPVITFSDDLLPRQKGDFLHGKPEDQSQDLSDQIHSDGYHKNLILSHEVDSFFDLEASCKTTPKSFSEREENINDLKLQMRKIWQVETGSWNCESSNSSECTWKEFDATSPIAPFRKGDSTTLNAIKT